MPIVVNISGIAGSTGASAEQAGEIQTVNFQWSAPGAGTFSVSTAQSVAGSTTNYPTKIQIFPADSNFNPGSQEVTYLLNQQNGIGNGFTGESQIAIGAGFQLGAMVAFQATAGQNYLIVVSERPTPFANPSAATYFLNWNVWPPAGSCTCGVSPLF